MPCIMFKRGKDSVWRVIELADNEAGRPAIERDHAHAHPSDDRSEYCPVLPLTQRAATEVVSRGFG